MTIAQTNSLVEKIHKRKSAINRDINSRIKQLQKHLVVLSFTQGNHSADYFATLGKIKELRSQIFDDRN
jgi:hypothetical protein